MYQVCLGQGLVVRDEGWVSNTQAIQERFHCIHWNTEVSKSVTSIRCFDRLTSSKKPLVTKCLYISLIPMIRPILKVHMQTNNGTCFTVGNKLTSIAIPDLVDHQNSESEQTDVRPAE